MSGVLLMAAMVIGFAGVRMDVDGLPPLRLFAGHGRHYGVWCFPV